jgi:hypothetical protein
MKVTIKKQEAEPVAAVNDLENVKIKVKKPGS